MSLLYCNISKLICLNFLKSLFEGYSQSACGLEYLSIEQFQEICHSFSILWIYCTISLYSISISTAINIWPVLYLYILHVKIWIKKTKKQSFEISSDQFHRHFLSNIFDCLLLLLNSHMTVSILSIDLQFLYSLVTWSTIIGFSMEEVSLYIWRQFTVSHVR